MNENKILEMVEAEFEEWAETKSFNSHLRKAFKEVWIAGARCGGNIASDMFKEMIIMEKDEYLKKAINGKL